MRALAGVCLLIVYCAHVWYSVHGAFDDTEANL